MKASVVHTHFLGFLTILSFILTPCKGLETTPADQNLASIVDLDETLDATTPSQVATRSFRDFFEVQDVTRQHLRERHQEQESKTSAFQKSFIKYVKEIYNKRDYHTALSQDASHIIQFLELSNEMSLGADIIYVCLRLFHNKIKACELVDDTVILQLLNAMPTHLERHFATETKNVFHYDLTFIKKHLESCLLTKFTEHLPEFQSHPDTFLADLAVELSKYYEQELESAQREADKQEVRERLRSAVIRFFETTLGKAIWTTQAYESIWSSFIGIANGLQLLGTHGIINHMDDLDDLLWSLVHRFCFFLDLSGAALPVSFYEEVEHDLESKTVYFLEYKEQDDGITTKKELLAESLLQAKAKAVAYQTKGIITTPMI